ncbi:MAG: SsrA-binding protein [Actinobacteria bacterium]|nr:SsrA-binding protein [Actinomycetota bacterium]
MVKEVGRKLIAQNKKARHDYFIEDVYECGLVLTGTEVKSLRAGRASLIDGFAMVIDGELITKLIGKTKESGLTLIPISLYFKDGKAKIELGLAKGKKAHDKRAALMEREAGREIAREMSRNLSGKNVGRSNPRKSNKYDD